MLRLSTTGLKSGQLAAQSVRSCLPEVLPYNWDEKLHGLVVGICLALSQERLRLEEARRGHVINALKRLGRRRVWKHDGKAR